MMERHTCRWPIAIAIGTSIVAAIASGAQATTAVQLGEAPRFDAPQDVAGWRLRDVAAEAPLARQDVVDLYNNVYLSGKGVALVWNGAVASCDPGTTNAAHQQKVIDRVNYFRALVGLPGVSVLPGVETTQSQAATLIMSANNSLSHFPPTNWLCYSADGAAGAGRSNLALGIKGVDAIDAYMDDGGANNTATGHRRWILYPPQVNMATGNIPASGANAAANDLYVFAPWGTRPATPEGIAWPPAGFVPYQNLPSDSNRWSFSFPGADFSAATVAMTGPNGPTPVPVTFETIQNGYGDNTIVFKPTGFPYGDPGADATYTVLVSGMTGTAVPSSVQYSVTVISLPTVAPPTLSSVASRKVHGSAGTFDLSLSQNSGSPTTEPRTGPVTMVFAFDKPVTDASVWLVQGTATLGLPTFNANEVIVPVTGVANEQYVHIGIFNVCSADGGTGASAFVRTGFLIGDVSQNRVVTVSDLAQVNAQIAQPVSAANFLKDVNASGTLTVADKGIANAQLTKSLPTP